MTSPQVPPIDSAQHAGHETRDVQIRGLLWLAGIFIVSAVVIHVLLWLLLKSFQANAEQADPKISPLAAEKQPPPEPRLQQTPIRDYQEFRAAQEESLSSYEWIDKQKGVVRIPVTRAMDLLLERGLPEPEGSASPQTTPAEQENREGESQPQAEEKSSAPGQGAAP